MPTTQFTMPRPARERAKGNHLKRILDKACREEILSPEEIAFLLSLRDPVEIGALMAAAREMRRRHFGDKVFLYGFVYFSTWCRNHCTFCLYRTGNAWGRRYRKSAAEIAEASRRLADSGVHLLDFTMGEDPFYHEQDEGFTPLLRLIRKIKNETGLAIMISWGVLPPEILEKLPAAGADWYACYQETHSRELFSRLRPGQDYDHRLRSKEEARRVGLLLEEGVLSDAGESRLEFAASLDFMRRKGFQQVRVMNFIPQKGTPMADWRVPDRTPEAQAIAVLRLTMPRRLIPASLDVYGLEGLPEKLHAGANVVTSLILPSSGINGVASALDIAGGRRTVGAVRPVLREAGLRVADREDLSLWMNNEKRAMGAAMA